MIPLPASLGIYSPAGGLVSSFTIEQAEDSPYEVWYDEAGLHAAPDTLVRFVDTSPGAPTAWTWDLDVTTSSLQNPETQYLTAGDYTISLVTDVSALHSEPLNVYHQWKWASAGTWNGERWKALGDVSDYVFDVFTPVNTDEYPTWADDVAAMRPVSVTIALNLLTGASLLGLQVVASDNTNLALEEYGPLSAGTYSYTLPTPDCATLDLAIGSIYVTAYDCPELWVTEITLNLA